MQSYRDLEVYQLAHKLGVEIYVFALRLPKFEQVEIGRQLRRAIMSISANIVEGFARRRYKADFIHYLVIAHASCDESIEWLQYIIDCHESLSGDASRLQKRLELLGRKLNAFIAAVERKHKTDKLTLADIEAAYGEE